MSAKPVSAEPKSHHTVQRAYLDGFHDPDLESEGQQSVWVYTPGKPPFAQKTARVAKRNYYYCHSENGTRKFDAEHNIQKLEDLALPVLVNPRQERFDISPEDRLTFAGYIALSHTRVPAAERLINRLAELTTGTLLEKTIKDDRALQSVLDKMNGKRRAPTVLT